MKEFFETLMAMDGKKIRVARFEPTNKAKGVIQMIHGFGESIEHYVSIAEFFVEEGYICVIHDQRGFGKEIAKKQRGVHGEYVYFLMDIDSIRRQIKEWYPTMPVYLFGHSMGGNIALNYLLRVSQKSYKKAVVESPWLGLYKPMPSVATKVATFLGKRNENWAIPSNIDTTAIAHDEDAVGKLVNDGIYHVRISFKLYAQVTRAGEFALKNAEKIKLPTLIFCAGKDMIVSPSAIRAFTEKADSNVELLEYPNGYHALHMDIGKEFLKQVVEFIEKDES